LKKKDERQRDIKEAETIVITKFPNDNLKPERKYRKRIIKTVIKKLVSQ